MFYVIFNLFEDFVHKKDFLEELENSRDMRWMTIRILKDGKRNYQPLTQSECSNREQAAISSSNNHVDDYESSTGSIND